MARLMGVAAPARLRVPDLVGQWSALRRPFRHLPRWAALAVLALSVLACVWAVPAEHSYGHRATSEIHKRLSRGDRRDFDLYKTIDRRVAAGENYYHAALAEQRKSHYPTKPFLAVRLPTIAWVTTLIGLTGWRVVAGVLWLTIVLGTIWFTAGRAHWIERIGAALAVAVYGSGAWLTEVGLSHEIIAGLFLSAALVLYRPWRWWPSLLLVVCALAIRELALPFVLLWAAFAASQRRWREFTALVVVIALFVVGLALHAQAVAAFRLPGDLPSQGWSGLQGPALALYGLMSVASLGKLPGWLGVPFALPLWLGPLLALLPLFGWASLGGRRGLFATLWFVGYIVAVSIFARRMNFYWLSLMLPVYGAGLVLVPRAVCDLVSALRRRPHAASTGSPAP
jgi:MFS family permease